MGFIRSAVEVIACLAWEKNVETFEREKKRRIDVADKRSELDILVLFVGRNFFSWIFKSNWFFTSGLFYLSEIIVGVYLQKYFFSFYVNIYLKSMMFKNDDWQAPSYAQSFEFYDVSNRNVCILIPEVSNELFPKKNYFMYRQKKMKMS